MNGKGNVIALIVIVVLLVGMMVFSYMRKKKYNNELGQMRKDLKIGDKVMTDTGVVGTLVDTYEEEGYQYFVLKSGSGNHFGYFAVHANAIYYVFGKDKTEKKSNLGINQKDKSVEGSEQESVNQVETSNQSTEETQSAQNEATEQNKSEQTQAADSNSTIEIKESEKTNGQNKKDEKSTTKKSTQKRASSKSKK